MNWIVNKFTYAGKLLQKGTFERRSSSHTMKNCLIWRHSVCFVQSNFVTRIWKNTKKVILCQTFYIRIKTFAHSSIKQLLNRNDEHTGACYIGSSSFDTISSYAKRLPNSPERFPNRNNLASEIRYITSKYKSVLHFSSVSSAFRCLNNAPQQLYAAAATTVLLTSSYLFHILQYRCCAPKQEKASVNRAGVPFPTHIQLRHRRWILFETM